MNHDDGLAITNTTYTIYVLKETAICFPSANLQAHLYSQQSEVALN
jgi:hypothetical protein